MRRYGKKESGEIELKQKQTNKCVACLQSILSGKDKVEAEKKYPPRDPSFYEEDFMQDPEMARAQNNKMQASPINV